MKITIVIVLSLLLQIAAQAQTCPCNDLKSDQPLKIPGTSLISFSKVSDGIYRGSFPRNDADYAYLHSIGIKTILSLESMPWHTLPEPARDQRHGFEYRHVLMAATPLQPLSSTVDSAVAMLNDKSLYPIYLHCYAGIDRTSVIVGFLRLSQGCHAHDVLQELRTYHVAHTPLFAKIGLDPTWPLHGLIDYFYDRADFNAPIPQCDDVK